MFHVKHWLIIQRAGDIMDVSALTSLIGTVGFPIVMCIMLYNRMCKQDEKYDDAISKLTETVNNNTNAINLLSQKMEGFDK